jgi:hypothetical protein
VDIKSSPSVVASPNLDLLAWIERTEASVEASHHETTFSVQVRAPSNGEASSLVWQSSAYRPVQLFWEDASILQVLVQSVDVSKGEPPRILRDAGLSVRTLVVDGRSKEALCDPTASKQLEVVALPESVVPL